MRNNGGTRRPRREKLTRLAQALGECANAGSYLTDIDRVGQVSTLISDQADYMSFTPEQLLMLARIESLNSLDTAVKVEPPK